MIINRDSDFKLIKRFIVYGGNAFNSTISIRKSILESYKSTLKYALRAEDEILFAIALDSGYNLILNSLQLTNYRISASNSSRISYKSNNSLNNRCNVLKKEIDTFSGILNIENLFKSQITRQYLTNAYSFYLLFYSSICSRCQKHPNHELIKSVKNLLLPIKTSNLFLFVLYFTSMIDKKFARRLYIIFRGD